MPFTPFHMGPGIAVKAVLGRRFSLMVFGFSQVAMDVEPLVRMIRGDAVVHGFTHTYLGATLVGAASAVLGRPVCQYVLDYWKPASSSPLLTWLRGPERISWPAAVAGAFVGTYSHVVLDSIMHADMRPLAPLSDGNALLHLCSMGALHLGCVVAGVVGGLVLLGSYLFERGRRRG